MEKGPNAVIPSEARNPSFHRRTIQEGFLASLGMTAIGVDSQAVQFEFPDSRSEAGFLTGRNCAGEEYPWRERIPAAVPASRRYATPLHFRNLRARHENRSARRIAPRRSVEGHGWPRGRESNLRGHFWAIIKGAGRIWLRVKSISNAGLLFGRGASDVEFLLSVSVRRSGL